MIFAALYLGVFSVLILIRFKFTALSMMSMNALNAAVILFSVILYFRMTELFHSMLEKTLRIAWCLVLTFIMLIYLSYSLPSEYIPGFVDLFFTVTHIQISFLFLTVFILIVFVSKLWKIKIFMFMLMASAGLLFKLGTYIYYSETLGFIPVLLYRYSGFLDIPYLFVLLYSIDYVMKYKFRENYGIE